MSIAASVISGSRVQASKQKIVGTMIEEFPPCFWEDGQSSERTFDTAQLECSEQQSYASMSRSVRAQSPRILRYYHVQALRDKRHAPSSTSCPRHSHLALQPRTAFTTPISHWRPRVHLIRVMIAAPFTKSKQIRLFAHRTPPVLS